MILPGAGITKVYIRATASNSAYGGESLRVEDLSEDLTSADGFGFRVETGASGELVFVATSKGVALPLPVTFALVLVGLMGLAAARKSRPI